MHENDTIRKNSSIIWLDVSGKWSDPHWPQTNYPFVNNGETLHHRALKTIFLSDWLTLFYLKQKL